MKNQSFFFPFCAIVAASSAFASAIDVAFKHEIVRHIITMGRRIEESSGASFGRVNQLLENTTINIADEISISEKVGFVNLNLVVDSLICRDISIGDVTIDHTSKDGTVDVNSAFNRVDAACDIEFQYEYGFLKGLGQAEVVTEENAANISLRFVSAEDKDGSFSMISSVTKCLVDIEIADINFVNADVSLTVISLFETYLRDLIEKEIEGYACSELSTSGISFLNEDLLAMLDGVLLDLATAGNIGAKNQTASSVAFNHYDTTKAINFQEVSETQIGELFQQGLDQLDKVVGSESGNGTELAINKLLRDNILDKDGGLVINVADFLGGKGSTFSIHDQFTETIFVVEEVRIDGLDSMTKFDPFLVVGDYTLRNEFSWESLDIEIDLVLDIRPSSKDGAILNQAGDSEESGIVEKITIQIGAENLDVIASVFASIDSTSLSSFTIGSLLSLTNTEDFEWVLPCFVSAIDDLHFVELVVAPQQVTPPTLKGFLDDGLDRIISDVMEIVFEIYHDKLVGDLFPGLVQTTLRTFINSQLNTIFDGNSITADDACPKYYDVASGDTVEYVDFRQLFDPSFSKTRNSGYGALPSLARDLLDQELLAVDPATGMPKINEMLIDGLTRGQSGNDGTLLFGGDGRGIFNIEERLVFDGFDITIRLRASDIKIQNLDTVVAPIAFLEPVPTEPHFLNNSITAGVVDRPVKLAARLFFGFSDNLQGTEASNEMEIDLDMYSFRVLATVMLKVVKSRLLGFPLVDVFDLNCWMATIPAPNLTKFGISVVGSEKYADIAEFGAFVKNLNVTVDCVECTSPGFIELSELSESSSEAQNDFNSVANNLLSTVSDLVKGDILQIQIDRKLNDASKQCRHSPNYDPNFSPRAQEYEKFEAPKIEYSSSTTSYLILIGASVVTLLLVAGVVGVFIYFFTRRRHRQWLTTLSSEQVEALKYVQRSEKSLELELNSATRSMFLSEKDIPLILRWSMPIIVLGNIALFMSGHLSKGATVMVEVEIAGQTIETDSFFEFSVARSTIDIWNNGGKGLAILILIFSGIWPYTKQLITLVLWFAPTSWVSISRRGSIFVWLDKLGKWSMIDIFVLIVSLAAFRVSINSPSNLAFLPEGFYSVDVLVVPLWGLYANLIAQLVSQVSSHFIIHYHRKVARKARESFLHNTTGSSEKMPENSDQKELLRTHQFGRPHRGEDEKLIVRSWTAYALWVLLLSFIFCIIAGCILPSFSIETFGLVGLAIEAGQEFQNANMSHSIFTVINLLFEEARILATAKHFVGLGSFSVIFVFTVLIVPLLQSMALLKSWFVPMTTKQRMKMSVLLEVLQAWQYAEVYIISIFIASWQLESISSNMVYLICERLDGFFSRLVFYGILDNENAQCFTLRSSIEEGCFLLTVGAILLALVNAFVTKATTQYFRDQDELTRQNQRTERTSSLGYVDNGENQEVDMNGSETTIESTIHPAPVLFTDTFRWLLEQPGRPKNTEVGSLSSGV